MKTLFDHTHTEEILARIDKLTLQTKPKWGKMNATQMLAHCTAPLQMAHGEIKSKRPFISYVLGKMFKKKMVDPNFPFNKNSPTDKNFLFPHANDFEAEKKKLIAQIKKFNEKGVAGITTQPHSFFGAMTPQEWNILQSKHIDHHLSQFGV